MFLIRTFILISLSFVASVGFSADNKRAVDMDPPNTDVAVVCKYHDEFVQLNKVLCAQAQQVAATDQSIKIPMGLACVYPSVRKDERICPPKAVAALGLPAIPYLMSPPLWPTGMAPVVTVVNGKALQASLKLDDAFANEEYPVAKYCISTDGTLQKSDRILCGPYVPGITLVDPTDVPLYDVSTEVPFASGSTDVSFYDKHNLSLYLQEALRGYEAQVKALGLPFTTSKVKLKKVRIVGRADASGDWETNNSLSQLRAYSTLWALKEVLQERGISLAGTNDIFETTSVGEAESSCYPVQGNPVCVTEDRYGNGVAGRRGWRPWNGSENDRCNDDARGRTGWIYPEHYECSDNDRSSRVWIQFKFELVDAKDVKIKALRLRLEDLEQMKANGSLK